MGEVSSLARFEEEYNSNLPDENDGTSSAANNIIEMNDEIRGSTEPSQADRKTLWAWYSEVTGSAKTAAKAFLEKVEKDNMVHEQLLTNFNTKLQTALAQATGPGKVAVDAKNYAAIVGDETPSVTGDVTTAAVTAYTVLQSLSTTNQAKAKAFLEKVEKRFKAVASRFTGIG